MPRVECHKRMHKPCVLRGKVLFFARALTVLLLSGLLRGCGSHDWGGNEPLSTQMHRAGIEASRMRIDAQVASSAEVDTLIAPYRRQVEREMCEILAYCPVEMRTGKPEGLLGALVADIVLERARREVDLSVDACVLNNGGLRIPWLPGEINLGLVYEVMPFDNDIVLLRLSADQMRTLADEIAAKGGEPVAGLDFVVRDGAAVDLRVANRRIGSGDYWVATNSYLAFGGGGMQVLWEALEVRQTGVLIRDAIADALRDFGSGRGSNGTHLGRIPAPKMGRIRFAPPGASDAR
ncbi:MAG: 5'-nucleotidase C-terminal domain-containing protein [Candidatus Eisenbacteria sp.]|nr:5'-nucleotidase C-terminal domain-containing protein [Candidatus Eisenbacteria bacterium]